MVFRLRQGFGGQARSRNAEPLSDWCAEVLGRPIEKGETLRAEGLQVTVRKLRRHRLSEAFVSKAPDTIKPNV